MSRSFVVQSLVIVVVLPQQVFEEGPAATEYHPVAMPSLDPGACVNIGPLERHPRL